MDNGANENPQKKKSENDMICKMLKYKQLQTLKCKNVLNFFFKEF